MKKIRHFKCAKCNDISERIVLDDVKSITCKCGAKANRALSAPKCFSNTVGKSPSFNN